MASAPAFAKTPFAFKSILIASDFSYASDAAATFVRILAAADRSTIYAVNVQPFSDSADWDESAWRWQFARANLQTFLTKHGLKEFRHSLLIGTGKPAEQLVKFANDLNPDVMIVGTHGRTGVNKMMIGSVAEQVIRSATCPVLTVGPHVQARSKASPVFGTIVVAVDFTDSCVHALACAAALAERDGAKLVLVHAVDESGLVISGYAGEIIPKAEMHMRKWLRTHCPALAVACLPVVRFGRAADVILMTAAQHDADLIVMGARRAHYPGFAAHSIATTAYKVILMAECAVLTLRSPAM